MNGSLINTLMFFVNHGGYVLFHFLIGFGGGVCFFIHFQGDDLFKGDGKDVSYFFVDCFPSPQQHPPTEYILVADFFYFYVGRTHQINENPGAFGGFDLSSKIFAGEEEIDLIGVDDEFELIMIAVVDEELEG